MRPAGIRSCISISSLWVTQGAGLQICLPLLQLMPRKPPAQPLQIGDAARHPPCLPVSLLFTLSRRGSAHRSSTPPTKHRPTVPSPSPPKNGGRRDTRNQGRKQQRHHSRYPSGFQKPHHPKIAMPCAFHGRLGQNYKIYFHPDPETAPKTDFNLLFWRDRDAATGQRPYLFLPTPPTRSPPSSSVPYC